MKNLGEHSMLTTQFWNSWAFYEIPLASLWKWLVFLSLSLSFLLIMCVCACVCMCAHVQFLGNTFLMLLFWVVLINAFSKQTGRGVGAGGTKGIFASLSNVCSPFAISACWKAIWRATTVCRAKIKISNSCRPNRFLNEGAEDLKVSITVYLGNMQRFLLREKWKSNFLLTSFP